MMESPSSLASPRVVVSPAAWQRFAAVYLMCLGLAWLTMTLCQVRSSALVNSTTLAYALRWGGIPAEWRGMLLLVVMVDEGKSLLALGLGVLAWLRHERAARCLFVFGVAMWLAAALRLLEWGTTTGAAMGPTSERIARLLSMLNNVPQACILIWYAGRVGTFKYPLRVLLAAMMTAMGCCFFMTIARVTIGMTAAHALIANQYTTELLPLIVALAVVWLLAGAIVKRPKAFRLWLMLIVGPYFVITGVALLVSLQQGKSKDPYGLAVNMIAPVFFIITTTCAIVLAPREPVRDDDTQRCHACAYNLTGNTSGVCPECGTSMGDRVAPQP